MQIQFTVIGDSIDEIAQELRAIADRLSGTDKTPEPAPEPEPKPPAKKAKAAEKPKDPEPEPEVEAAPEPAKEEPKAADEADPEKDWKTAADLLMKIWTDDPSRKDDVLSIAGEFGVKKFSEVPKEKGTELLAKARALVA